MPPSSFFLVATFALGACATTEPWLVWRSGAQSKASPELHNFLSALNLPEQYVSTLEKLGYEDLHTFVVMSTPSLQIMTDALVGAGIRPGHVGRIVDAVENLRRAAPDDQASSITQKVAQLEAQMELLREQLASQTTEHRAYSMATPSSGTLTGPIPKPEGPQRRGLQAATDGELVTLSLRPAGGSSIGTVQHGGELRATSTGDMTVEASRHLSLRAATVSINASTWLVNGMVQARGDATIDGSVSAASATISGAVSAASAVVTGDVSAASTTISGAVSAGSATVSGTVSATGAITSGARVSATAFVPTSTNFVVEGDGSTYYPVSFSDGDWGTGPFEFEITRSSVHRDGSWVGALQARFWGHSTAWGHGADFMNSEIYSSRRTWVGNYGYSSRSSHPIVWLLGGGYTYTFRALTNRVTLSDYTTSDKTYNGITYSNTSTASTKTSFSGAAYSHRISAASLAVGTGGSISSGFVMQTNGNVRVVGSVTGDANYVISDARVKKEVSPIIGALRTIKQIRGVMHKYKGRVEQATAGQRDEADEKPAQNTTDSSDKTDTEPRRPMEPTSTPGYPAGRHYGFLAQELEAVVPEIVHETPSGLKAVQYEKLTVLLTEAVKELSGTIDSMASTMESMRHTIAHQGQKLVELENARSR